MKEYITLVNENDEEIGTMEKLEVHKQGLLHRAFSILVFNQNKELLLQRRNESKYHSPGLWTNTCCSHQRMGETLHQAAKRRLQEEMGFICELEEMFHFTYHIQLGDLFEHEVDHVFFGEYDGEMVFDPDEVAEVKWMSINDIEADMKNHPDLYTYWFHVLFPKAMEAFKNKYES